MYELLPDVTRIAREAGEAILAIYSEADMQVEGAELCMCTGGPLPVGSSVVFRKAA